MRLKKIGFEIICHNMKTAHIITSHENQRTPNDAMLRIHGISQCQTVETSTNYAFNLLSSHAGQYGSSPPCLKKYRPSGNRPLHSYSFVSCDRPRYSVGIPTAQQKHSSCHSDPKAFTTVSVTGFRHFLHLVE